MDLLIWVAGSLACVAAIGVVASRSAIYSALSLVLSIVMLAVVFLAVNAQFLFAVQIIIYAGAVMVLFVFIIALLSPSDEDRPLVDTRLLLGLLAGVTTVVAVGLAAANGGTLLANGELRGAAAGAVTTANPYHGFDFDVASVNVAHNVQTVAGQLFTIYLLPFEITSLLLLVAAIGAVYLTRRSSQHI